MDNKIIKSLESIASQTNNTQNTFIWLEGLIESIKREQQKNTDPLYKTGEITEFITDEQAQVRGDCGNYNIAFVRTKKENQPCYCIQKWVGMGYYPKRKYIVIDNHNQNPGSTYWDSLEETAQNLLKMLSVYGYPSKSVNYFRRECNDSCLHEHDCYVATQVLAWEFSSGRRTGTAPVELSCLDKYVSSQQEIKEIKEWYSCQTKSDLRLTLLLIKDHAGIYYQKIFCYPAKKVYFKILEDMNRHSGIKQKSTSRPFAILTPIEGKTGQELMTGCALI